MNHCPCGSAVDYQQCCQPLHQNQRYADSPQQLMASRYCAFVVGEARYLLETHHPDYRNGLTEQALADACGQTQWHCLQITDYHSEGDHGEVEFKAWYKDAGQLVALHERSRFLRQEQCWQYCDGVIKPNPSLPGRNDPCLCGSGKKFKKCCG